MTIVISGLVTLIQITNNSISHLQASSRGTTQISYYVVTVTETGLLCPADQQVSSHYKQAAKA